MHCSCLLEDLGGLLGALIVDFQVNDVLLRRVLTSRGITLRG